MALGAGATSAFGIVFTLYLALGRDLGALGSVTMSMCLFCTLISYVAQLWCFLWLRRRHPQPEGGSAFRSPLGICGASAGLVFCVLAFMALLCMPALKGRDYFYGLALAASLLSACVALRSHFGGAWVVEALHRALMAEMSSAP
mmetsp:Transcript_97991/g.315623  ORF Transcript_97991/g.315623 Transcript_97991/m.315623 type:complete len:144 (+) Transcript_97991:140-571(+)